MDGTFTVDNLFFSFECYIVPDVRFKGGILLGYHAMMKSEMHCIPHRLIVCIRIRKFPVSSFAVDYPELTQSPYVSLSLPTSKAAGPSDAPGDTKLTSQHVNPAPSTRKRPEPSLPHQTPTFTRTMSLLR